MNEVEVERQIDQMVRFIKQEAEEKANEIAVSAEEARLTPKGWIQNREFPFKTKLYLGLYDAGCGVPQGTEHEHLGRPTALSLTVALALLEQRSKHTLCVTLIMSARSYHGILWCFYSEAGLHRSRPACIEVLPSAHRSSISRSCSC